jgi:AraC-like DNA-binding protein
MLPHVPSFAARALLASFSALGMDAEAIREKAGIPQERLDDPDDHLGPIPLARLWTAASDADQEPHLGLRAGLATPFGAYDVIDYLANKASTVGEAVGSVVRYFGILNTPMSYEVHEDDERVVVEVSSRLPWALVPNDVSEYAVGVLTGRLQRHIDPPVMPLGLYFRHNAKSKPSGFGYPVVYGADMTALHIDARAWRQPMPQRDDHMQRMLARYADMLLAAVPAGDALLEEARGLLAARLDAAPTLQEIASSMGASGRTLQRQLKDRGTTFQKLLDDTRSTLAQQLLRQRRLSMAEVGYLVGYAEPSAFHRAFKRWTGTTPRAYRRDVDP